IEESLVLVYGVVKRNHLHRVVVTHRFLETSRWLELTVQQGSELFARKPQVGHLHVLAVQLLDKASDGGLVELATLCIELDGERLCLSFRQAIEEHHRSSRPTELDGTLPPMLTVNDDVLSFAVLIRSPDEQRLRTNPTIDDESITQRSVLLRRHRVRIPAVGLYGLELGFDYFAYDDHMIELPLARPSLPPPTASFP